MSLLNLMHHGCPGSIDSKIVKSQRPVPYISKHFGAEEIKVPLKKGHYCEM